MKSTDTHHTADQGRHKPGASVRWALTALSLSALLPALGTSIANVSLPTLASTFHASLAHVQWIVLAYLLSITTLIVSIGRLGDLIGRRRLLLVGIAMFTLASVLCGAASTLWLLLAARAIQGVGAAIMLSLGMAFVGETVSKDRTGSAMGLLGTVSALGTALGPSIGGMLIAGIGWRAIFLINLPLGGMAFILALRCLPPDPPRAKAGALRFDYAGTLILAMTLGAYALAVTVGGGRFGPRNLVLAAAALAGVWLFVLAERRVAFPLLQLALFRNHVLSASLIMSALVSAVMMATLVVGPFYLALALGFDTAGIGLILSIGPIAAALTGIPAGRIADRLGTRAITCIGLSGIAAGSLALALAPLKWGVAAYIVPILIMTISYALFQTANNTAVMANVPPDQRGLISGMLNLARNLGLITGASVMGAVFTLGAGDIAHAQAQAVAAGMRLTFAIATALMVVALAAAWASHAHARRVVHFTL